MTERRIPIGFSRVQSIKNEESSFRECSCSDLQGAVKKRYAEHTGANLLPCNAAARLQALGAAHMHVPIAEFDQTLEQMIREFAVRILIPRWTEFDAVWETANKICDRYDLGKFAPRRGLADAPGSR